MGGGRIFLKTFRAFFFNDDLSKNEPNSGRIYLAGQYLYKCKNIYLSTLTFEKI